MKIDYINIKHFRCFDSYECRFAPGITVLFGRNGAGKSSLINAIHKTLSFIFSDIPLIEGVTRLGAGNSTLRVERYKTSDIRINPDTGNAYPTFSIEAQASVAGREKPLSWTMEASTSTLKPRTSKYLSQAIEFSRNVADTGIAPVLAYYSDSYPHVESRSTVGVKVAKQRNLGYHQWNEESACSSIWIKRFKDTLKRYERSLRLLHQLQEQEKPIE